MVYNSDAWFLFFFLKWALAQSAVQESKSKESNKKLNPTA